MIIDVTFQDDRSITPAVMVQALRHLIHSLESNLKRQPRAPFIAMGGSLDRGSVICWLHFHTDPKEQAECRGELGEHGSQEQDSDA